MGLFITAWCLGLALVCFSPAAQGWDHHVHLTEAILPSEGPVAKTAVFVPLDEALAQSPSLPQELRTRKGLVLALKLNKQWAFPLRLEETPGKMLSVRRVLSFYCDEPDWGVDQGLFADDQYPELWTPDTKFVAGKTGLKSQGFRHMFFPGIWDWREPVASLQVPMRPLGEAPDRAERFATISAALLRDGQTYWGYRFLAWSLHFVADLSQPFHVRQTPSKAFLVFEWKHLLPGLDIERTGEQIGYYHLSYETWVDAELQKENNRLRPALSRSAIAAGTPLSSPLSQFLKENLIPFAASHASRVGALTRQIFPPFHPQDGETAEHFVGSPAWQATVQEHHAMPELIEESRVLFERLGQVTREMVADASRSEKKMDTAVHH